MDDPKKKPAKDESDFHMGATEDQMDIRGTVPQRINRYGHKIEDEAGTGEHDSSGG